MVGIVLSTFVYAHVILLTILWSLALILIPILWRRKRKLGNRKQLA